MGSKSKYSIMKSSKNIQKESETKKSKERENTQDIVSKSSLTTMNINLSAIKKTVGSKSIIMNTLKNNVQLIGNVGQEPTITNLESGKKVARFSLATNEHYRDGKGEKKTQTNWHSLVAWGKTAEIIEKYASKGKEIAISGKLTSRSYETAEGDKRYITEVLVHELLLLGFKDDSTSKSKPTKKVVDSKKENSKKKTTRKVLLK